MPEFKIDPQQFKNTLGRLDTLRFDKKVAGYRAVIVNITNITERKLKFNLSGNILRVRTGKLRNSIGSRIIVTSDGIAGVIGSGVRTGLRVSYANVHESSPTGGDTVIRPRKGKYLAIPLKAALTRAGALREPSPRDYDNTFIRTTDTGKLIIFQKLRGDKVQPLFVLVKQVTIPARKYLSRTLTSMHGRILRILKGTVERKLAHG